MNTLYKATELLKNGWCRFVSRDELPTGTNYCSSGALCQANGWDWGCDVVGTWDAGNYIKDMALLADVIRENYPQMQDTVNDSETVIRFNDDVAEGFEQVLAVFEKAAVRKDELV